MDGHGVASVSPRRGRAQGLDDLKDGPSLKAKSLLWRAFGLPLLTVLILSSACISQTRLPYRGDPSEKPGSAQLARYSPPPSPPDLAVTRGKPWTSHDVLALCRPNPCAGPSEPGPSATAYISRAPGAKRWIVVLPIWGSSTYPPRKIVRWFLAGDKGQGTNVLWIHGKDDLIRYQVWKDVPTEDEFRQAVARSGQCIDATVDDVRGFLDWILERPDADPKRIGIVGFSIGAMVASLVMGHDPRVSAGAFVMAGGHPSQILATCGGRELDARQKVMARFGWSLERYAREVETYLGPVDPVSVAGNIDPASVLYIDAGKDACMPMSSREDLWHAMGEPERITVGYGHRKSFLSMTILGFDLTTRRIVRFLDNRLAALPEMETPERASQGGASSSSGSGSSAPRPN